MTQILCNNLTCIYIENERPSILMDETIGDCGRNSIEIDKNSICISTEESKLKKWSMK